MVVDATPQSSVVKPTFLYTGASKAGSSWIYEVLREHPEVFVPPSKDIMFFDTYYHKGLDWYLGFFAEGKGKKAIGELSSQYAQRIAEAFPKIKIFCCLREVIDKMISEYVYNQTTGVGKGLGLEEFAKLPEFYRQYTYYANLKSFYDLFPGDNILVLFYDDLEAEPAEFVRRIYDFLGVNADFEPPSLLKRVNPAHDARVELLALLAYRGTLLLRNLGLVNLVGRVKRSRLANALLYKPTTEKPDIPLEARRRVRAWFSKDYDKLAQLIGHPLPSSWLEEEQP